MSKKAKATVKVLKGQPNSYEIVTVVNDLTLIPGSNISKNDLQDLVHDEDWTITVKA